MKKYLLPLFLLAVLAFSSLPASAQAQASLSINPSSTSLQAGQSATLAVRIADVTDLYAYDITLRYDPSVIEITSIENGSFLKGGFTAAQVLDKSTGTAQIAFTSIPPFTAQSGSGDLVTFKVKAKSGGSAQITIENTQLLKKDATAIPASTTSGMVVVSGSVATDASRPVTNPGGSSGENPPPQQPESTASVSTPGAAASTAQPTRLGTLPAGPTKNATSVPVDAQPAQQPTPEPEGGRGVNPLFWMIPLGLALLAAGYYGGNFLRDRAGKK